MSSRGSPRRRRRSFRKGIASPRMTGPAMTIVISMGLLGHPDPISIHALAIEKKEDEMEGPVLADKTRIPTEETVFTYIGKFKSLWISFFDHLSAEHPDIQKEWRYYNDGKSWLFKVTRKAKTVFWLSLSENSFRITFYFSDKAEPAINGSGVSDELKEQFKNGKRYNKIRGLTIYFKNKKDVEYAKELTEIKLKLK
jgi:hypothetical protein